MPYVNDVIDEVKELTPEQRLAVFGAFCNFCGCDDPKCQCWNDE